MLDQTLLALALSGGTAVVAAAGTDTWEALRHSVARWFGREDAERERAELERLDQTATALRTAGPDEAERARGGEESAWQARFAAALGGLDGAERQQAAERLREVLTALTPEGGVTAGPGSLVVRGDTRAQADNGSIAAGVINGGARIGTP
ncbi:hypothetical protein [Streptomyces sp. NBC_01565]|uniref:hypothetical protein n=1 Tax=Streptomyces sp. NBC_01565 TaxID=2975881 RepID=UPI00225C3CF2|nr:hypothetical protein [Streptomyces sp. NBC_01565]MCX4545498.1 hypothetical protein [Streptomyces sp. NBC_01565]